MFQELMPLLAQRILLLTLSRVSDERDLCQRHPKITEIRSARWRRCAHHTAERHRRSQRA